MKDDNGKITVNIVKQRPLARTLIEELQMLKEKHPEFNYNDNINKLANMRIVKPATGTKKKVKTKIAYKPA